MASLSMPKKPETTHQRQQWLFTLCVGLTFLSVDVSYVMNSRHADDNTNTMQQSTLRQIPTPTDKSSAMHFPRRRLAAAGNNNNKKKKKDIVKKHPSWVEFDDTDPHLTLLQLSDFQVLGPTQFPPPTRFIQRQLEQSYFGTSQKKQSFRVEVQPTLEPVLGQHRPDQDAVFVFASEYELNVYQGFILSLRKTGFEGDIVLAVSPHDIADPPVTDKQKRNYEFFASDPHVIIYQVPFVCYNAEGVAVDSAKGGIRICHCHVLYSTRNVTDANAEKHLAGSATDWQPLQDSRTARPVATTRYELYWAWSIHYQPHTWQFLVDARDTYFQSDPFAAVPREPDPSRPNGVLFFFGENSDATRIGKSDANRKWLTSAYGQHAIDVMQDKPTICSGATLGEQIALETYLRAMVNEFDETQIKLMGMDQGFHNYLYYSNKLSQAQRIRSISVFDQGRGIVNNMGAMRTKDINEWGNGKLVLENGKEKTILNWDGQPSPVIHQFDRFKELGSYIFRTKTKQLQAEWKKKQKQAQKK